MIRTKGQECKNMPDFSLTLFCGANFSADGDALLECNPLLCAELLITGTEHSAVGKEHGCSQSGELAAAATGQRSNSMECTRLLGARRCWPARALRWRLGLAYCWLLKLLLSAISHARSPIRRSKATAKVQPWAHHRTPHTHTPTHPHTRADTSRQKRSKVLVRFCACLPWRDAPSKGAPAARLQRVSTACQTCARAYRGRKQAASRLTHQACIRQGALCIRHGALQYTLPCVLLSPDRRSSEAPDSRRWRADECAGNG
jgi:hypothetical protein